MASWLDGSVIARNRVLYEALIESRGDGGTHEGAGDDDRPKCSHGTVLRGVARNGGRAREA